MADESVTPFSDDIIPADYVYVEEKGTDLVSDPDPEPEPEWKVPPGEFGYPAGKR